MDPHYYDPAWTQSVGYGPSVNEHTERPTFAHSYKQPHVLSDGFENLYQGPPDSSAGQGSMQQGSGFYVRPATIMTSVSTGEPSLQGYGSAAPVNSVAHAHTSSTVGTEHNLYGPSNLDSLHELQQVSSIQPALPLPYDAPSLFGFRHALDGPDFGLPNKEDPFSSSRSSLAYEYDQWPISPSLDNPPGLDAPRDSSEDALAEFLFPELVTQQSHSHSSTTGNSPPTSTSYSPATTSNPYGGRGYYMQPPLGTLNLFGVCHISSWEDIHGDVGRAGEIMAGEISAAAEVQTRCDIGEMPATQPTASYIDSPSSASASPFTHSGFASGSASTSTSPSSHSNSPLTPLPHHLPPAQRLDGRWICPCGASIKRDNDFNRHLKTVHPGKDSIAVACGQEGCGTTFSRLDARRRHVKEGRHGKPRGRAKAKQAVRMGMGIRGGVDMM